MSRVLNGFALIGVQVCFDAAYANEAAFLLNGLQHGLNGVEEMRVYDFPVIHERMCEHKMTFRRHHPVIEMPGKYFGHKQIPDRLKMWRRKKIFINFCHGLQYKKIKSPFPCNRSCYTPPARGQALLVVIP